MSTIDIIEAQRSAAGRGAEPTAASTVAQSTPRAIEWLRAESLVTVVQRDIEDRIVSGAIAAGTRLNEMALAQALGTSRGPLREALRALGQAGLVRVEKNRGVFVRQLSLAEALEFYELRTALEGLVGRLAAQRIARDELANLRDLVRQMHRAQRAGDAGSYFGLNLRFHDGLARAAHNDALLASYRGVVKQLDLFRRTTITRVPGHLEPSTSEHEAIAAAVAAGDAGRAERLLAAHVLASRERLTAALAAPTPSGAGDPPSAAAGRPARRPHS